MRRGRKFHFEKAEKTNLIVPGSVKKAALAAAGNERLSLSQWVVRAICEKLEAEKKIDLK